MIKGQQPAATVSISTSSAAVESCNWGLLSSDSDDGIKLGSGYKQIYGDFVKHTTHDISALAKKWEKSGVLDDLLTMSQY